MCVCFARVLCSVGECMQHCGAALMIITPFCPGWAFLPLAGLGNAFRAASFMAWGATTALFERHLVKNSAQLADLVVCFKTHNHNSVHYHICLLTPYLLLSHHDLFGDSCVALSSLCRSIFSRVVCAFVLRTRWTRRA
jgi:hypothetical protein